MVKIKRNVKKNLPQLIEWAWDNDIRNKGFESERTSRAYFDYDGYLSCTRAMEPTDTFTVEVEEEITEDTEVPTLVMFYENHNFKKVCRFEDNVSISDFQFHEHEVVLAYYMLNEDLTMTLIWRDGKLVE